LRESPGREFPQLLVNQRQELFRGLRVASFDGGKNASYVGH
jgi:hypothetical protein